MTTFSIVFRGFGKSILIAALVLMTGAQWAALQTVAWTTMLAGNLRTQSFSQAVSETFDGHHPCPLCKAIAAGKKSEKKSETISPTLKLEFTASPAAFIFVPPAQFVFLTVPDHFAMAVSIEPPLQPPRSSSI